MTSDALPASVWSPRRVMLAGAIVFVLAAVVRVALLHTARFGGDEALFFRIGMDIVEGRAFPLLGTQITDGAARLPGPTFLYVMALPLVLWRAPEAQFLFVELLGALTVFVFWDALRRPFGERAAFMTGLLVACAPWSALYADRTWNPNVLPLVVALAFSAALRAKDGDRRAQVLVLPLCAVMPHFHMAAPVAWAGLLALLGRAPLSWRKQEIVMGLGLSALFYLPLLVNEAQTGFENTRLILAETVGKQGGERHPLGFVWVPVYALRFLTLDVTYHELSGYWGGPDEWKCLRAAVFGSPPRPFHPLRAAALFTSLAVVVAAVVVVGASAVRRRRLGPFFWAALFAVAANTALMGLTAKQVFGHYVTNCFFFVVVLWAALFARLHGRAFVVGAVAALMVCLGGVEATWSVSQRVDAKIGLAVHRAALGHIIADADADGVAQTTPVALLFRGVHDSHYGWHAFATRGLGVPLHFDNRASERRYLLSDRAEPAPRGAVGPARALGHAYLWRLAPTSRPSTPPRSRSPLPVGEGPGGEGPSTSTPAPASRLPLPLGEAGQDSTTSTPAPASRQDPTTATPPPGGP